MGLWLTFVGVSGWSQTNITAENDIHYLFEQATIFKNKNNLELALDFLQKATEEAEKREDIKALIDCYHKFSLLYLDLNKEDSALFYWDRGTTLLTDIAYPYGNAIHKFIEATLLYRDSKYFQAIYMLNEAKQLSNDRNLLNHITLLEGNIYLQIEKYDNATKNYNALAVNSDLLEKNY
ncbi:hypothetical protein [Arenibacter sp. GZD-96]|uniref:hypothetical protein n=1 Tax=Aurantibrevibacter litoralis TaxID=3106030 RepID=UPI002AFF7CA2|nr:hypothetical protein [Arenibacter sp. GZD-96]